MTAGGVEREMLAGLLDFSINAAAGAGKIVLRSFRQSVEPERKPDGTYVTAADRAAETYLRDRIRAAYPRDEIIGEEFGVSPGESHVRWIIDPIDGTFSFVHGVPLFGVLIGVEVDGVAAVGVAHFPAIEETIEAARGLGCRRNGKVARVSKTARLDEALVVASEPRSADRLVRRARHIRGWSDCYGYMLVASGVADVTFDPVAKEWDCAALMPIVEEAGGTFTDWRGVRTIRGGSAVATNGLLHDEVISMLSQAP